jgi:hypothetical protein
MPGIAELEARLSRISAHPYPSWAPEAEGLQDAVDQISRQLFGFTEDETYFVFSVEEHKDLTEEQLSAALDAHEQHFRFLIEDGEEADRAAEIILQAMGWDVTDGDGGYLRSFDKFGRQIVAVAKGLVAHHPDRLLEEDEAASLEARLRAEASNFRPRRKH